MLSKGKNAFSKSSQPFQGKDLSTHFSTSKTTRKNVCFQQFTLNFFTFSLGKRENKKRDFIIYTFFLCVCVCIWVFIYILIIYINIHIFCSYVYNIYIEIYIYENILLYIPPTNTHHLSKYFWTEEKKKIFYFLLSETKSAPQF